MARGKERTPERRVAACARCGRRITDNTFLVFLQGDLFHVPCWQALTSRALMAGVRERATASREVIKRRLREFQERVARNRALTRGR